jgi:hypothetical protein
MYLGRNPVGLFVTYNPCDSWYDYHIEVLITILQFMASSFDNSDPELIFSSSVQSSTKMRLLSPTFPSQRWAMEVLASMVLTVVSL